MMGDYHVRFCERLEGWFLLPTRPQKSIDFSRFKAVVGRFRVYKQIASMAGYCFLKNGLEAGK